MMSDAPLKQTRRYLPSSSRASPDNFAECGPPPYEVLCYASIAKTLGRNTFRLRARIPSVRDGDIYQRGPSPTALSYRHGRLAESSDTDLALQG